MKEHNNCNLRPFLGQLNQLGFFAFYPEILQIKTSPFSTEKGSKNEPKNLRGNLVLHCFLTIEKELLKSLNRHGQ